MFFLSAGTYSHYAVLPIAEGVEFSPFGRRKNDDILGIFLVRRNYVFSVGPRLLLRKILKKVIFLGNFWEYISSKNAVFSGYGSRIMDRKNPGYLAGWLAIWLAG